ncbi:MAG: GAF domain-containing protein [Chloroflexi bacterium]|nr:MAG: GAF domain-containing protein [Chloroflexota bacterium]
MSVILIVFVQQYITKGNNLNTATIYIVLALQLINMMGLAYLILKRQRDTDAALATYTQNLTRRVIQLETAAEVARDVSILADGELMLNVDTMLVRITELVRQRFGFYHAGVFLIEGDYAILKAASGPTSEALLAQQHRLKVGGKGIVGFVTGSGEPRISLNVMADDVYFKNPDLPGTRSELAIPFRVGNKVIGALDVQSIEENAFDDADVLVLQALADLLAIAIQKLTLHQSVQDYANELEKRVIERTKELAAERAQLRVVLDSMSDGVVYTYQNQVRYVNRALCDMLGFELDLAETSDIFLRIQHLINYEMRDLQPKIHEHVEQYGIWRGETTLHRRDGAQFEAGITVTRVERDLEMIGTVTVIRDISQEKALQAQKARFVANASHELRTPITNLKTRLYLIKRQPGRYAEHLKIIEQVTNHMERLVEDLLDVSRFDRGTIRLEKSKTHVQELIEQVVMLQRPEADKKNITLTTDLQETPVYMMLDSARMNQVLTNLVINAINYTPHDGHILVRLYTQDDQLFIEVIDTGVGISQEHIDNLFLPFFRVSQDRNGTGLGLTICKNIVELHGGTIQIESEPGQGSKFTVCLMLDSNDHPSAETSSLQ